MADQNPADYPIGTNAFPAFERNVENLDTAIVDRGSEKFPDRKGVQRYTYHGIEQRADRLLTGQGQIFDNFMAASGGEFSGFMFQSREEFQRFLESSGYSGWNVPYAAGIVLNSHNQGFTRCEPDGTACMFYTPLGTTQLPYTTTGNWASESALFVARSADDVLRQDLANPNEGAALVAAGNRTQKEKNSDIISVRDYVVGAVDGVTDNQIGIEDAIDECLAKGAILYWPAGIYVSSGSIANFHSVQHVGTGVIRRNGNTFTPGDQRDSTVNELFISATGVDSNDGLSSTEPTTLNSVTMYLKNYGPVLHGKWRIKFAEGVYSGLANASRISGLSSTRFVEFVGPDIGGHPNVPTVHIDGAGGNSTLFVARGWGLRIQLQDIHMRETLGAAMSATEGAVVQWINVHQTNCAQGLTWGTHAECYVSGGIHRFETGFSGFALLRALFLSKHNIGYRINEENWVATGDPQYDGPQLLGNGTARGISLSENSTGHVRSCLIDRFAVGLEALSSSRAHIEYSEFTRNSVAADIQAGANVFDNNTRWNPRGSNRNTITRNYRGGTLVNTMAAPMVQLVGWDDAQASSASGSTWKLISSPYSWDGRDNRPGMMMKIAVQGTLAGTTSTKSLRLSTNGASICSIAFPAAAAGPFYVELGFIKKAGDFVLPFGFGNCAGLSGAAAGIGEAVVQYQEVNRIMDDDVVRTVDLFAMTESTNDSISFGTVHCYRAG